MPTHLIWLKIYYNERLLAPAILSVVGLDDHVADILQYQLRIEQVQNQQLYIHFDRPLEYF